MFVRLFIHETRRAFEDRMINVEDMTKFRGFVKQAVD